MMTLDERLQEFVATWEPSQAHEFLRYDRLLRAKTRRPPCAWGQMESGPYWKDLPRWVCGAKEGLQAMLPSEFLDAASWGQTCLFYAVRLQDDFFDGGLPRSPLALAPLLFLSEADRAYSSIFDSNASFWNHYRRALGTTVAGIVRVAEMQRDPRASADELLQTYGNVDAIFSVGSSAVCERLALPEGIPRVSEFVSALGKVLLVLDDLEDIEEDLADGRLNYPARILLGEKTIAETDLRLLARNWHRHVLAEGSHVIETTLLRCLNRAENAIRPLEIPPAIDLLETTKAAVRNLRRAS